MKLHHLVATMLLVGSLALVGKAIAALAAPSPNPPHVMVVMMENKNYSEVIGQTNQPYTNHLAVSNGLATQSYATTTGLPNYLAIVCGSTLGVGDVLPSQQAFPNTATVADQLSAAGYRAKAYAEDLPPDPTNTSGNYNVQHFPWPYFPNTHITVAAASALVSDLESAFAPAFVWYTPNAFNDEDTGSVQRGDAFLSRFIPQVQATSWYRAGGKIIIEWDESSNDTSGINGSTGGGRVPTIVVSAGLAANPKQDPTPVGTLGILRSIENIYGLSYLQFAANPANGNIDALLASSAPATRASGPTTTSTTQPATTTVTTPSTTSTFTTLSMSPTRTSSTTPYIVVVVIVAGLAVGVGLTWLHHRRPRRRRGQHVRR